MSTSIAIHPLLLSLIVFLGSLKLAVRLEAAAANLADFGYASMIVDREPPLGPHPLLVVLFNIENGVPYDATHTVAYFDSLVFSLAAPLSINGYHWENSNGRFFWTRAGPGVIGPIRLSIAEGYFPTEQRGRDAGYTGDALVALTDLLYHSNLVARTMMSGLVNLVQFDDNADGTVSADELHFLFVVNEPPPATVSSIGARRPGCVRPPGFSYSVCPNLDASIQFRTAFDSAAHELTHTLGATDLYHGNGVLSDHLTLMGRTSGTPDDREIFHLDPWHKMRFGWCEPRIRSLRAGGVETIPAVQMANPNAPIILYDPVAGTSEYFILEYRTRTSPNQPGYDADAAGDGLVVWRVKQDGNRNPVVGPHVDAGSFAAQSYWRLCQKCSGMHEIANNKNPIFGSCPEGGFHSRDNSGPYLIVFEVPSAPGEHGWRWCRKCRALFFGPGQAASHCPLGATHDGSQSGDYSLLVNTPEAAGQDGWRWCRKCQSMFYGPNESQSDCPADRGRHDGSQSGNYAMLLSVWGSGSTTPRLRWADGTLTRTRLHVRPFAAGAGSITVEWLSEEETWVDFSYLGLPNWPEDGSSIFPFNSLAEGVASVAYGGTLKFRPGSTPETATINKRVNLEAIGGPVTLGRIP